MNVRLYGERAPIGAGRGRTCGTGRTSSRAITHEDQDGAREQGSAAHGDNAASFAAPRRIPPPSPRGVSLGGAWRRLLRALERYRVPLRVSALRRCRFVLRPCWARAAPPSQRYKERAGAPKTSRQQSHEGARPRVGLGGGRPHGDGVPPPPSCARFARWRGSAPPQKPRNFFCAALPRSGQSPLSFCRRRRRRRAPRGKKPAGGRSRPRVKDRENAARGRNDQPHGEGTNAHHTARAEEPIKRHCAPRSGGRARRGRRGCAPPAPRARGALPVPTERAPRCPISAADADDVGRRPSYLRSHAINLRSQRINLRTARDRAAPSQSLTR
jgi:hypothetical protein